jgi:hypothetical protein
MHPGTWRSKLKSFDEETFHLTSWVSREGNWFVLHAEPDSLEELLTKITLLRKCDLTVELADGGNGDDRDEAGSDFCANHLSGRKCKHAPPYCK